jgi:hypothetical protein
VIRISILHQPHTHTHMSAKESDDSWCSTKGKGPLKPCFHWQRANKKKKQESGCIQQRKRCDCHGRFHWFGAHVMDRLLRAFILANKHNKTQIVPGISRADQSLTSGGLSVVLPMQCWHQPSKSPYLLPFYRFS